MKGDTFGLLESPDLLDCETKNITLLTAMPMEHLILKNVSSL